MDRRVTGIQVTDISRSASAPRNTGAARRSTQCPPQARRRPRNRRAWYIRRRNQLLRRMGLLAVGLVLVVTVAVKGISALRSHSPKEENGQWSNEDMMAQNDIGRQLRLVGDSEPEITDPIIVLDAGHGGKDPGTMADGVNEKDINLAIVKKIQGILEQQGYQVIQTRSDDTYLTLSERVKVATDAKAAAFVSIHQNALERDTVTHGIQIYCNKDANPDSERLTDGIYSRILSATGAYDRGKKNDSDFHVVEENPVPSCLVETGFLTAAGERENLLSDSYQQKIAQAVAEGIIAFLGS